MRITADRDRCASSGMCALTAPAVFDQDEVDGRVIILHADIAHDRAQAVADAIELCPASALSASDD